MGITIHTTKDKLKEKPVAVLFDLDNTLYDYEPAHRQALLAVREKANSLLGISGEDFDKFFLEARSQVKKNLGNLAGSHSRLLYFQRLIEMTGLKTQILQTLDLEQTYWRTFLVNAKLFDNVIDFIKELKIHDIPLAIVTDLTAQIQFRKLVYFQLTDYFDCVVTSEEVGKDKPEPKMFQTAIDKLDLEHGSIWMIGDNYQKDIKGAKNTLSAVTLQKTHKSCSGEEQGTASDIVFESYFDLVKLISEFSW